VVPVPKLPIFSTSLLIFVQNLFREVKDFSSILSFALLMQNPFNPDEKDLSIKQSSSNRL
jgi:hypothetical protein